MKRFIYCFSVLLAILFIVSFTIACTNEFKTSHTSTANGSADTSLPGSKNTDVTTKKEGETEKPPVTNAVTNTTDTNSPVTTVAVTTAPPPPIGTPISVSYTSSNSSGGYLIGSLSQNIKYGKTKTSSVRAVANLGYRFKCWSDGNTSQTRVDDSPTTDTTYTAVFEIDTLDMPILMLTTETGTDVESKEYYTFGTISVLNAQDKYLIENYDMQIRGRGNYTWGSAVSNPGSLYDKRPYKIKLSAGLNLLGIGSGKARDWVLLAEHCDQSLIRNYTAYSFAKSLDGILWQPSCVSVEVFLNGEYRGVYLLAEQVEVDDDRIAHNENYETEKIDFLIHMSGYASGYTFHIPGTNQPYEIKNDLSSNITLAKKQITYINTCVRECWDAIVSGNEDSITSLIDINSVIDAYICHETFKNLDSAWDNFYMHKTVNGKLMFGPVWDFDQSGGNADEGCEDYRYLRAGAHNSWFYTLLSQEWFKERLVQRWNVLLPELNKIPVSIRFTGIAYNKSFCRNFDKWDIFGMKINRETEAIRNLSSYNEHNEYYAVYMEKRIEWLTEYFNSPDFSFSGKVTFEGQGTKASPYLISSANDFANFTAHLASGNNFSGNYFKQTTDIDMRDISYYNGVGAPNLFSGYYDGDGHTIYAEIQSTDSAIFPYLNGTVINLHTRGSVSNTAQAGGFCRSLRIGGVIANCISSMDISSSGGNAGGFSASNQSNGISYIVNCLFNGSLYSPNNTGIFIADCNGGTDGFYYCYYTDSLLYDATGKCTLVDDVSIREHYKTLNNNTSKISGIVGISVSLNSWKYSSGDNFALVPNKNK